jgi:glutaredoxin
MDVPVSTAHQATHSHKLCSIGMTTFLLLSMLSYMQAVLAGDLYRWQDETGKVRYSDKIPPPSAKNVTKLKSVNAGLVPERKPAQPFDSQAAATRYPLALFSFPVCGTPCKSAEEYLNKRGVPYTLKNQDQDKIELKQITGKLEVPVLLVGKEILRGFEMDEWRKLLDAAGYTRENPYAKPGGNTSAAEKPKAGSMPAQETLVDK